MRPGAEGGSARLVLSDRAGFEAQLASRTSVPPDRARAMRALGDDDLRRHAHSEAKLLRRFANAVAETAHDDEGPSRFVRTLDLRAVSRDHDWRAVFATLREASPEHGDLLRLAIARYLEYLRERKTLLEYVRRERGGLAETDDYESAEPTRPFSGGLRRLPMGEPAAIRIPYRGELRIRLGSHAFRLRDGYPPQLIDPDGRARTFAKGRQSVGRHPENEIVVDRGYNDVSRAHLILEWNGGSVVHVTDLSSRGTFVEAASEDGGAAGR